MKRPRLYLPWWTWLFLGSALGVLLMGHVERALLFVVVAYLVHISDLLFDIREHQLREQDRRP
jgi:hypothetical protein